MGNKRAIAAIAGRQHGVVTVAQLMACGFSRPMISKLVATGWLHRIHRGVYAVGHPGLSTEGWWMAAVLTPDGQRSSAIGTRRRSGKSSSPEPVESM